MTLSGAFWWTVRRPQRRYSARRGWRGQHSLERQEPTGRAAGAQAVPDSLLPPPAAGARPPRRGPALSCSSVLVWCQRWMAKKKCRISPLISMHCDMPLQPFGLKEQGLGMSYTKYWKTISRSKLLINGCFPRPCHNTGISDWNLRVCE